MKWMPCSADGSRRAISKTERRFFYTADASKHDAINRIIEAEENLPIEEVDFSTISRGREKLPMRFSYLCFA